MDLLQLFWTPDLPEETSRKRMASADQKFKTSVRKLGYKMAKFSWQVSANQICLVQSTHIPMLALASTNRCFAGIEKTNPKILLETREA